MAIAVFLIIINQTLILKKRADLILAEINECTEKINEKNRNLNQKSDECDNLNREKNAIELKIKELEHKKETFNEQLANNNRRVS